MDPTVREFLEEIRFAVVATLNADGSPQQTVLWYELQGDSIMVNTARDRVKDRNLRRDPRMWVCLEDGYRYVTASGRVEIVDDQAVAQADIRNLAIRYHGADRGEQMSRDSFQKQHRVTILLSLDNLTAYGF
ncbi:MAG: PPOX class F420-dependent oxidoreductase [Chloroflexia bacterium]